MALDHPAKPLAETERTRLLAIAAELGPKMVELAQGLWENPELGYLEEKSSALLAAACEEAGFEVKRGVGGLPTAFLATRKRGEGPVIGFLAEMDALPGFSQDASPRRSPIPDQNKGHACGHHLFGAASLGAGLALATWQDEAGLDGEIRIYGCPAEEGGAGKVFMARAGLFEGLDIALHWHPDDCNTVWQSRSLASINAKVRFHGRTAHAAMSPEKGRSSLHALEAFHHMASLMREVVPQDTHIHYVTLSGGEAPNVIPDFAESHIGVRHPDPGAAAEVFERIEKAAEGAALGTGTRVEVERLGAVHSLLPNSVVGAVMLANMEVLPRITWSNEEYTWAAELQESFEAPPELSQIGRLNPYNYNALGPFSTDVGDVSWLVPTGMLGTATWVPGTRPHTWQAVAAGGMSIGWKGMQAAAEGLAVSGASFLADPALVARAWDEHRAQRGEGYRYKALVGDAEPPFDYQVGKG
ncbi:aminobenzoyl-glutamate utilization protein B [Pseudooceanicola antarcticus]|uniref:Amidohydrolase n=1 Tax=Pseudooceanicola antarcticus TaxID=1247613 RepID=A0A285IEP7_9RHOB|nr:amidohydrolase [Pseudooceanicola antarcticus]PJE29152.1 amidohydrolase [Pseudooceanicola antarcticus]SNY46450.1 aminobenzoyl-glutamate utilization protein B [Pseudooceanicola antarcticus]